MLRRAFKLFVILSFIVAFLPISAQAGLSNYEFHHIFPQEYFGYAGNKTTFKLAYMDHKYTHAKHNSCSFDDSWSDYAVFYKKYYKKELSSEYVPSYVRMERASIQAALAASTGILEYCFQGYDFDVSGNELRANSGSLLKGPLFNFDGVSCFFYNTMYIISSPYKLFSGIYFAWTHRDPITGKLYGISGTLSVIWWLVSGVVCAFLCLFVGLVTATLFHPILTFNNILWIIIGYPCWSIMYSIRRFFHYIGCVLGVIGLISLFVAPTVGIGLLLLAFFLIEKDV